MTFTCSNKASNLNGKIKKMLVEVVLKLKLIKIRATNCGRMEFTLSLAPAINLLTLSTESELKSKTNLMKLKYGLTVWPIKKINLTC